MNRKKVIITAIICLSIIICISMILIFKSKTKQNELSSTKEETTESNSASVETGNIPSVHNNENLDEKKEVSQDNSKGSTTKGRAITKKATSTSEFVSQEEANEVDESNIYTIENNYNNNDSTPSEPSNANNNPTPYNKSDTNDKTRFNNKSQSISTETEEGGIY